MQVTNVKIEQLFNDETKPLRAVASIVLDNNLAIHDIRVIQTVDKLFVAMPNKKIGDKSYKDVVHPINDSCRLVIEGAIISAYQSILEEQKD